MRHWIFRGNGFYTIFFSLQYLIIRATSCRMRDFDAIKEKFPAELEFASSVQRFAETL